MRVLTATKRTQGQRSNDFSWTVEGELVTFPVIECGHGTIDDGCGCKRSMAGLASHRATTTVQVTDRPDLTPGLYRTLIVDGLKAQGYLNDQLLESREVQEWVGETVDELVFIAAIFEMGTVLERRDGGVSVRAGARPGRRSRLQEE